MIQKIFHTDKWWGKTVLIILTYAIFWFISYGVWVFELIPQPRDLRINDWIPFVYFFVFIPILSFKIASYIRKITQIKFLCLIIFNVLYVVFTLYFLIRFLISDFPYGGF